jgi:hypothetical protein
MTSLPFHHSGYVVDDLDAAVAGAVARSGAGPFYVAEHMEFEAVTFHGQPAMFDHSSAFGQWGPIRVKLTLIHATDPPSLERQWRRRGPIMSASTTGWPRPRPAGTAAILFER